MSLFGKPPPVTVKDLLRALFRWKHNAETAKLCKPSSELWALIDQFEHEAAARQVDHEVFDDPSLQAVSGEGD